jgi:glutamine cyclotransferase
LNEISLDDPAGRAEVSTVVSHGKAVFGEGLTILADRIFQLTWKDKLLLQYEIDTFEQRAREIAIDGWGLTNDGRRLIVSDGSATLHFFDPDTLAELGTMKVRRKAWGLPRSQAMINEMEMVGRKIFANIYRSNEVVRIDLETGCVDGVADFSRLYDELDREQKRQVDSHSNNVLNGIAYSKERGTFFLTGKRWPVIFEVSMDP